MAGKYTYISWCDDPGIYTAYTHGCDCCSQFTGELTVKDLEDHISELEDAIKEARTAIERIKRVAVLKQQIKELAREES